MEAWFDQDEPPMRFPKGDSSTESPPRRSSINPYLPKLAGERLRRKNTHNVRKKTIVRFREVRRQLLFHHPTIVSKLLLRSGSLQMKHLRTFFPNTNVCLAVICESFTHLKKTALYHSWKSLRIIFKDVVFYFGFNDDCYCFQT